MEYRDRQLRHGRPQLLHQKRSSVLVVAEQPRASIAAGQQEHGDLVARNVDLPQDEQLQHGRGAVGTSHLENERLGPSNELPNRCERPFGGQASDEVGQVVDPLGRAGGRRLVRENVGY